MKEFRGILMIITATAGMGFIPFFSRVGFANGLNPYTLIFFRCLLSTVLLLAYMKTKKIEYRVDRKFLKELAGFSFVCYGLMIFTLVSSYNLIPTGIGTTLHFIYPAAVLVGSALFYKERLTLDKAAAVVIAMVGIFLLSAEGGTGGLNTRGVVLAVLSGVLYAAYMLKASHGRIREMNSYVLVYYLSLFNIPYFAVFAFVTGNFSLDITLTGYLDVIALSVLSVFVMSLFKSGLNYVSSCSAAVLSTFEPLTSIMVGVFFFGESFTLRSALGTAVIVAAVIFISFIEKKGQDMADDVEALQ